jgi:hypothetical protein
MVTRIAVTSASLTRRCVFQTFITQAQCGGQNALLSVGSLPSINWVMRSKQSYARRGMFCSTVSILKEERVVEIVIVEAGNVNITLQ